MAKWLDNLEIKLADLFKSPKMAEGGVKTITEWAPWIALIFGILSLWAALGLWHWAHAVDKVIDSFCNAYAVNAGACAPVGNRLTFWVWLGILFLIIEGLLYLLAYPGLKARSKQGWNYLFYGALVNVLYSVVMLFSDYSGVGSFIGSLLVSAVGLWILFQIRVAYLGAGVVKKKKMKKSDA
jgi:hypothetical protein